MRLIYTLQSDFSNTFSCEFQNIFAPFSDHNLLLKTLSLVLSKKVMNIPKSIVSAQSQKMLYRSVALSKFLANGHLPCMSLLSANDKGENEMKLEAVHRSPSICLTAEENLR
jgi:hypothetical protein